jgi:hypothetical protein
VARGKWKVHTTRASRSLDSVLRAGLLAGAVEGALLAAGAGCLAGTDALAGAFAAAAGCWLDHFAWRNFLGDDKNMCSRECVVCLCMFVGDRKTEN